MAAATAVYQKIREVHNVHADDIHALLPLPDRTFVTGSKDGSLKKWDLDGKLVSVIYDPGVINYHSWITALAPLGRDRWLSGTRDGYIHLWDVEGNELNVLRRPARQAEEHRCKQRNWQRVNCLADFGGARFLAGWPTQFTVQGGRDFHKMGEVQTSENDWVYAIHPIREAALLVVTGGRVDLLEQDREGWRASLLVKEGAKRGEHRSFISALTPLRERASWVGLSIFNGYVSVYDFEAHKIVMSAKEHQKRVWTIENVTASVFASCADDGTIKLWDLRNPKKSVMTLRDNVDQPARVSVLLSPQEDLLISGSCPDAVRESEEKAMLSFWDLKKG